MKRNAKDVMLRLKNIGYAQFSESTKESMQEDIEGAGLFDSLSWMPVLSGDFIDKVWETDNIMKCSLVDSFMTKEFYYIINDGEMIIHCVKELSNA